MRELYNNTRQALDEIEIRNIMSLPEHFQQNDKKQQQ